MSARGRPNIYVEIVRDLGGTASANEIFVYGSKNARIKCSLTSCRAAIAGNIRNGNLIGSVHGRISIPRGTPVPLGYSRSAKDFLPQQIVEITDRLSAIEKRLNDLEMKQRLNLPF
jgi:hypothetical protein